jgi:hypothetical protein
MFATGFGLVLYDKLKKRNVRYGPFWLLLAGSLCVLVSMICFMVKPFERDRFLLRYDQEMMYLIRCEQNDNLTGAEIVQATEIIIRTNTEINTHWRYYKNPWIGVYYDGVIAELPTYDVRKIPVAHILQDLDVGMTFSYGEDWKE